MAIKFELDIIRKIVLIYHRNNILTNFLQDACRLNRPAEMNVDKVKLHYVVHYINRGTWDHIVPEEGEKEGKIDSYR